MDLTLICLILELLLFSECNPCQGMSIGDCDMDESQIVGRHPFNKELCHKLCKLDDKCLFWRHNSGMAGSVNECLFLSTDYHQVKLS